MNETVRLWRIDRSDALRELPPGRLDLEARLQSWLARDVSLLSDDWLVIGREVPTDLGGFIDLLCLDHDGNVVVVELKRGRTPREVVAQALDYASQVKDFTHDRIVALADAYLAESGGIEQAFEARFGRPLPETLNESHRVVIVGSALDDATARIVRYLSEEYGVGINAATFSYHRDEKGEEFLTRAFVLSPPEVDRADRKRGSRKRRPNLTPEELSRIAEENGVGELYRYAVERLSLRLMHTTTRSTSAFLAREGNRTRTILGLAPGDSSAGRGLRYHVYSFRLAALVGVPESDVAAALGDDKESWIYYAGAPDHFRGYRGYFRAREDLDRFLALFDA